jgi:hypothetical protein
LGSLYGDEWWESLFEPRDPRAVASFLRRSAAPVEERAADAALTRFTQRFASEVVSEWTAEPNTPWRQVACRRFWVDGLPDVGWRSLTEAGSPPERTFRELVRWHPRWAKLYLERLGDGSAKRIAACWFDATGHRRDAAAEAALLHELAPGVPVNTVRSRVRPVLSALERGEALVKKERELVLTALGSINTAAPFCHLAITRILAPLL